MINVTKVHLPNIDRYKKYIDKIYSNGQLTNNGPLVNELERRLQEYLQVDNLILVSNGTIALQVAYEALNIDGDVITTPFSFVATVSSMIWSGLKPNFVDISPNTLNIDCEKIEDSITKTTKAIAPVHVFGNVCDIEFIEKLKRKYRLKVIYDASHCFGVKDKMTNRSVLNYGDISTISFHATKIFHTIEGGAIIVKEKSMYEKIKKMINFGIENEGQINHLGINAKMNEFQAAMGLCMLDDIDTVISKRKTIYDYYKCNLLSEFSFQKLNDNFTYNYCYFPIVFDSENKLKIIAGQLNEEGIYPRRYFYPSLETLPYIEDSKIMKNSNDISKRILCLPLYDSIELNDVKRIIKIINNNL